MTEAERWLRGRLADAPASLVDAMAGALPEGERPVPEAFAAAGFALYRQVLSGRGGREDALPLLAADALFTHALEAQAEADPAGLAAFALRMSASREFEEMAGALAKPERTFP